MKVTKEDWTSETVKVKAIFYKSPLPRKMQRVKARGRSSKPRVYTAEQIFLFKLKKYKAKERKK